MENEVFNVQLTRKEVELLLGITKRSFGQYWKTNRSKAKVLGSVIDTLDAELCRDMLLNAQSNLRELEERLKQAKRPKLQVVK